MRKACGTHGCIVCGEGTTTNLGAAYARNGAASKDVCVVTMLHQNNTQVPRPPTTSDLLRSVHRPTLTHEAPLHEATHEVERLLVISMSNIVASGGKTTKVPRGHVAFEDDGGTTSPGKKSTMVGLLPVTPAPAAMEESSPESSKGAKSPIMSLRKASLALPSNRVGQVGRDVLLALGAMKIKDLGAQTLKIKTEFNANVKKKIAVKRPTSNQDDQKHAPRPFWRGTWRLKKLMSHIGPVAT